MLPEVCARKHVRIPARTHPFTWAYLHTYRTHVVYMCIRTPTDMPFLTRLHAHRHVYVQHTCKRVWPSQPRALTFSHRSRPR